MKTVQLGQTPFDPLNAQDAGARAIHMRACRIGMPPFGGPSAHPNEQRGTAKTTQQLKNRNTKRLQRKT
eukprot:4061966-Lingulodinium_polyedra.AAC.1